MITSDWTDVTRDGKIDYDLEAHPLQIKTDSAVGSNEEVYVYFYTADGSYIIGYIRLMFYNSPKYFIYYCTSSATPFSVTLPVEQDKVWTITKTASALKVECNGVEVLNYLFSESTKAECVTKWSKDVEQIRFAFDTASDAYWAQPGTYTQCLLFNYPIVSYFVNKLCRKTSVLIRILRSVVCQTDYRQCCGDA